MANVLVRVELHAATSVTEYEALHRAMEQIGFQRTIRDVGGATYRLPTASYYSAKYATVPLARDAASKASAVVSRPRAIIASGDIISWDGLEQV